MRVAGAPLVVVDNVPVHVTGQGSVDAELEAVLEELHRLDPDRSIFATTLRNTLDQLYDGQHTGRYRWDQLYKTEKTHCGTLVEINLQRAFEFGDGDVTDYRIAGIQVDCKYSQSLGGWMIPNEARGELCLVVTANDVESVWSAGVIRAKDEWLNTGKNRDAKVTLSRLGRENIGWFAREAELPSNVLLHLAAEDVAAIFSAGSGQARINELFRRAQRRRIGRGVIATVAQQEDYMKRIRGNGGARSALAREGIVIFGQYDAHATLAAQLGLERVGRGESMSARLAPSRAGEPWTIELDGRHWRLADFGDPVVSVPNLPRVTR